MKKYKKHIVLITAHFYPTNHIAAYRMNGFVKYLDSSQFDISVITINSEKKYSEKEYYNSMVLYVPFNNVFRMRKHTPSMPKWKHHIYSLNNKLIRFFSKSDFPGWRKNVKEKLVILNKRKKVDVIISSFSPVDSHLIGLDFKSIISNVHWIADMRDEMSLNQMIGNKERSYYRKIEQKILSNANIISSVSNPILEGFKNLSHKKELKFLEIRNGFDHNFKLLNIKNKVFTFIYAGTFYGKRKPDSFFKALLELYKSGGIKENWKIIFIGTHKNFHIPNELENKITFTKTVDNKKAIEILSQSDCSLLIHPPSTAKGIYTGKLFDYLSVKRPILGILDKDDVAAELIEKCRAGICSDFHDIEEIKRGILTIISNWENDIEFDYNSIEIEKLHRKHQVLKLEKEIIKLNQ
ncbi:MAG: hypothetical protein P8K10_09325 [Crocinitomicaceae bacterium]|nr:hypothetical protein [Crocinitomicaceae bacterium]